MTCPNCDKAATRADWPFYTADCRGCIARGIANGPEYWRSCQDGKLTADYKTSLRTVWGEDWKTGHDAVKAAAARLEAMRTSTQGALL